MKLAVSFSAHVAAVIGANYLTAHFGLVSVGFGLLVTAGTFAAGFALLARDFVQRYGGIPWALAGVLVGGAVSWFTATPMLAVASTVAFLGAELVDLAVFTPLRRRGFFVAALSSNVVSAPIDTVLFLAIAGFPITWQAITGQFIGKVVWATLIPLALYVVARRAVLRESVNTQGA